MQSGTLAASVRPAKFARLDWNSCLCHNALDRSISDSEPLTLVYRKELEIASSCRCPPQGPHDCFPSAARTVLTSPCLVECIIASATSRTLTSGNWTSWQRDSLRKLQADDEQDHDDGEQLSISISRSDVMRSLEGSQGKHSPVLRLPQACRTDPESTARRLTRSKVDKTLCDWCLFCQEARKKVKGVSIKLLQVAWRFDACWHVMPTQRTFVMMGEFCWKFSLVSLIL